MPEAISLDRVPLVVGVTGHRNVAAADEAPLRAAFGGLLNRLKSEYPATPLLVMSGLAAGADVLAAEEALTQSIPVIACLPMPVEMYEEDFSHAERARFRKVLARCVRTTIVATPTDRKRGYVATGLYIAHYSHVLVAFWDGLGSQGEGGTADVVQSRMTGELTQAKGLTDIRYPPDVGPVYQIVTPREGMPRPPEPYTLHERFPERYSQDDLAARDFKVSLQHLDAYNADLDKYGGASGQGETPLRSLRDRTDAVANRLQKTTNFYLGLLFIFGFLGASAQKLNRPELVALNVAGIILTFVFFFLARKNNYENRYQDYRALAEGLRVQEAWFCAGLTFELVDKSYLRMQQSELQWIRMALRCAYLVACEGEVFAEARPDDPICREWIDGQWTYYKDKRLDQAARQRLVTLISNVVIGFGSVMLVVASALLVVSNAFKPAVGGAMATRIVQIIPGHESLRGATSWIQGDASHLALLHDFQTVPITLAALAGVLLWQYAEKRSYAANARRYQRMYIVFDRARERLRNIGDADPAEAVTVIRELGQEALVEHADWLLARRDRPISIAHVS